MKIMTFGDSWAAGYGLKKDEKNFTDFLAQFLRCKSKNFGVSSSSLGHILHDFTKNIHTARENDLVIVIIPPDVRWYTESGRGNFTSLLIDNREYQTFVKDKTNYWFRYHHSLFIYSIHSICSGLGLDHILAHNYGTIDLIKPFDSIIPNNIFLNRYKSLTSLLGAKDYNNYDLNYDGPPDYLIGKNFISNDTHPNQEGHKIIAELLLEKYYEKQ